MGAIVTEPRTSAIWERILFPAAVTLTAEQARFYLGLRIPEADRNRANELSAKASAGTLTPDEEHELDEYLLVDSFLTRLKAKARICLKQADAAS